MPPRNCTVTSWRRQQNAVHLSKRPSTKSSGRYDAMTGATAHIQQRKRTWSMAAHRIPRTIRTTRDRDRGLDAAENAPSCDWSLLKRIPNKKEKKKKKKTKTKATKQRNSTGIQKRPRLEAAKPGKDDDVCAFLLACPVESPLSCFSVAASIPLHALS